MSIIFIVIFSLVLVAFWWFSRKGLRNYFFAPYQVSNKWIYLFDFLYGLSMLAAIIHRIKQPQDSLLMNGAIWFRYIFMGITWLFLLICFLFFLLDKTYMKKKNFDPERRLLFKRKLSLGALGVLGGATVAGYQQAIDPKIEEVTIPLSDNFKGLSGLKIAQLSDIHIGPTLKKGFLENIVAKANAHQPDLIVITGDMIDGRVEALKKEMLPLKDLQAKLGVYFITGNHEYYWNAFEWIDFVKEQGIKVLLNTHETLSFNDQDFVIGGVTDLRADRIVKAHKSSATKAIAGANKDLYKILLAHQPLSCHEAEEVGWNLQLSGHTHGGQGMPWNLLVGLVQPYLKGLYKHKSMDLYVNRGTGYWGPPYRLGIPGEVTHITLV